MEIFYTCAIQYGSHKPHVANEHKKFKLPHMTSVCQTGQCRDILEKLAVEISLKGGFFQLQVTIGGLRNRYGSSRLVFCNE